MKLKDITLAIFKENINPLNLHGIKLIESLDEIHDYVSLYFVDRDTQTISELFIEEYFPINIERGGVIKGKWNLGGYNGVKECFFSMGTYHVDRRPPNQTFVEQERLNKDEVYMKDHLRELIEG